MGYAISPTVFAMAMGIIVRPAREYGRGVQNARNQILPPIHIFMDDLTLLNPSIEESWCILAKLKKLMNLARMKFKPKKIKKFGITGRKARCPVSFCPLWGS